MPVQEKLEVQQGQELRQRTYELLAMAREPSSEERRVLAGKGFIFLRIEAKTLRQVVSEHSNHFCPKQLDYINALPGSDLCEYTPKAMEVALNPNQLYIPNSFNGTQAMQMEMIKKHSTNLEKELPSARVLMLPAAVQAQADIVYFKKTGKPLFADHFVRSLDQTSGSLVANVGRYRPKEELWVNAQTADDGDGRVGALFAVVLIK